MITSAYSHGKLVLFKLSYAASGGPRCYIIRLVLGVVLLLAGTALGEDRCQLLGRVEDAALRRLAQQENVVQGGWWPTSLDSLTTYTLFRTIRSPLRNRTFSKLASCQSLFLYRDSAD